MSPEVKKMSAKFVLPEYNVPPDIDVAFTEVRTISESRFTTGLFGVPPVLIFVPPNTLILSGAPAAVAVPMIDRTYVWLHWMEEPLQTHRV